MKFLSKRVFWKFKFFRHFSRSQKRSSAISSNFYFYNRYKSIPHGGDPWFSWKFAKTQKNVEFFPKIKIRDIPGYYFEENHPFKNSCIFPWLSALVYPNGDVNICRLKFGNLHEQSLKSIVNGNEAVRFKRLVRSNKFNSDLCFRCCHRRYY